MQHHLGNLKDHLEKLYSFCMIANIGSITHAAKLVHLSQAALSRSMIALESGVGRPLFIREQGGVRLTEAGNLLFEFSKKLFLDLEAFEANFSSPNQSKILKLRVGTHEGLTLTMWPDFLYEIAIKKPQISVALISGRIDLLTKGLLNREFHLILTVEPKRHPNIRIVPLFETTLGFYKGPKSVTSQHELLSKSEVSIDELNELSILTDASAHLEQDLPIPTYLIQQGLKFEKFFEINSFEAAVRLSEKGLGVAILPKGVGDQAVKNKQLLPLKVKDLSREDFGSHRICVTVHRSEEESSPANQLLAALVNKFKGDHKLAIK